MEELQDRLRTYLRDHRDESPTRLAQLMGTTHNTMMGLVMGKRKPSKGTRDTIERFLDSR